MNKFSERVMIKKVDSTNKLEYNKKKLLSAILGDSLGDSHGQGWLGHYRGIGAKLAAEVLVSSAFGSSKSSFENKKLIDLIKNPSRILSSILSLFFFFRL